MLIARNLHLTFGEKSIFNGVSFTARADQKIGLVGRNGTGKSTLLRVLAGTQELDEGEISFEKGKTYAYLPQEVLLQSQKSILDEAFSTFEDISALYKEYEELEKYFAQENQEHLDEHKLERYAHLQAELADVNYGSLLVETKRVLEGLGFKPERWDKTVDTLSVGWKMRLVLAKLLLKKADFYLFDEPTNHLDIVAKDWFAQFLRQSSFGYLLVSHDRYFLDTVCNYILELDRGIGTMYTGNYTRYLGQKEQNIALVEKAYEQQQKEIKKKQELIDKFRAKASKAKMAQSLIKSMEKMDLVEPPSSQATVSIKLATPERPGKVVLTVKNITHSFDGNKLFDHVSFEVGRDEKVALIAANGTGKTTLMNLIMGKLPVINGSVEFGHNVKAAFFEQDQDKSLNAKKTILDEVEDSCTTFEARSKSRSLLGSFLFPGNDVYKKIGVLSGGEKNRVAMVKVLLQNANFLILDEPTNHLDLESKEILLKALQNYAGTILFVSHDREFLSQLATKIVELTPHEAISFPGNYEEYLYSKQQLQQAQNTTPMQQKQPDYTIYKEEPAQKQKQDPATHRFLQKLETKIDKLEKEIETLQLSFATVEYGTERYNNLLKELAAKEKERESTLSEWEKLI